MPAPPPDAGWALPRGGGPCSPPSPPLPLPASLPAPERAVPGRALCPAHPSPCAARDSEEWQEGPRETEFGRPAGCRWGMDGGGGKGACSRRPRGERTGLDWGGRSLQLTTSQSNPPPFLQGPRGPGESPETRRGQRLAGRREGRTWSLHLLGLSFSVCETGQDPPCSPTRLGDAQERAWSAWLPRNQGSVRADGGNGDPRPLPTRPARESAGGRGGRRAWEDPAPSAPGFS